MKLCRVLSVLIASALVAPGVRGSPSTVSRPGRFGRSLACRLSSGGLDARLREQANRTLPQRIAYFSSLFLGTPYATHRGAAAGPLGPDLCAVDCETLVEQVIALARSENTAEFQRQLRLLRFVEGIPLPAMRHFTVVRSWLAAATRNGFLRDITAAVGGGAVRTVQRDLTPVGWSPAYLVRYFALGVHAPAGVARLPYLPMPAAMRRLRRIPSGTIVHLVAAPHPRSPYLVTHVGIVLKTRFGPIFRHASQSPHRRRVEDRPLGPYLYYARHTPAGPEMRTPVGIHLSEVLPPRRRGAPPPTR